jgi:hypothetical protein
VAVMPSMTGILMSMMTAPKFLFSVNKSTALDPSSASVHWIP